MASSKVFNVHDLYPADYCFDYEAFYANPEGYVFTPNDIAYYNAMELERYKQPCMPVLTGRHSPLQ